MLRKGVVCLALLATGTGVHADPNWIFVGGTDTAHSFIDSLSIKRSGNIAKVWVDTVFNPPQTWPGGAVVKQNKGRWIFNCADQTSTPGSFNLYAVDQSVIATYPATGVWSDVVPGSVGEGVMKVACAK